MESSREAASWRAIRWAAYACLALALLQVLALPWPLGHPEIGAPAVARWIGQISLSLLGAVALFYRRLWAAVLLGLYALTRLYVVVVGVVHLVSGSAGTSAAGPEIVLVVLLPLPFAALWIRGAWAALRLWRDPRRSLEQAA